MSHRRGAHESWRKRSYRLQSEALKCRSVERQAHRRRAFLPVSIAKTLTHVQAGEETTRRAHAGDGRQLLLKRWSAASLLCEGTWGGEWEPHIIWGRLCRLVLGLLAGAAPHALCRAVRLLHLFMLPRRGQLGRVT